MKAKQENVFKTLTLKRVIARFVPPPPWVGLNKSLLIKIWTSDWSYQGFSPCNELFRFDQSHECYSVECCNASWLHWKKKTLELFHQKNTSLILTLVIKRLQIVKVPKWWDEYKKNYNQNSKNTINNSTVIKIIKQHYWLRIYLNE